MIEDFALPAGLAPVAIGEDPRGFRSGRFTASELARLAARLAERGPAALAGLPLDRRLAAWVGAVEALLDPDSDERLPLMPRLVATSRLSAEGLAEGLRLVLEGVAAAPAAALAQRVEAGAALPLGAVLLAGNVPALAAQALLPALLCGRPLLVKSARAEPLFAAALVRALAAREPALADAFAALVFPGEDAALAAAAFGPAERIVAYGGAEAVAVLAERFGDRLIAHGPKASLALVGADVDPVDVGRALARDVALFDQRGCLSVHAVYTDGDATALGEALVWGLACEHLRLPPGPIDADAAAAVHQLRGAAELAGRLVPGLELAQGTVILDTEPRFRPSPGLRTVRVHALERLDRALAALEPWRGRLQGAAVAGARAAALTDSLGALGLSRVAAVGRLQAADAAWANGGVDPLVAFGPTSSSAGW